MREGFWGSGTDGNGTKVVPPKTDETDDEQGRDCKEVLVCAWWKKYGEGHGKTGEERAHEHIYTTRLRPSQPIELGSRVRLVALSMSTRTVMDALLEQYEPYDPHVCGRVIRIARSRPGWVVVTLCNECKGNEVGRVGLEMPHVQGMTVRGRWLSAVEDGVERTMEMPRGRTMSWRTTGGCGAEACTLKPAQHRRERTFRTRPMRGDSGASSDLRAEGEGVLAMHLWLKYEYAR